MMVADLGYGGLMALVTTIGLHFSVYLKGRNGLWSCFKHYPVLRWFGDWSMARFSERLCHFICYRQRKTLWLFLDYPWFLEGSIVYRSLFGREGKYSQERFLAAVNQGFSWQGLLAGLLVAAAGNWLFTAPALVTLGLIIAGLSGLLIVIVPIIKGKSKLAVFHGDLWSLWGNKLYWRFCQL